MEIKKWNVYPWAAATSVPREGELRAMMDDENLILRKFVDHLCSKILRDDGFIKHETKFAARRS